MVAGSPVLGGGRNSGSEMLGVVPVLSWLVAPSILCCRVAMVAALKFQIPATKDACARWVSYELDFILKEKALDILNHEVVVGLAVHLAHSAVVGLAHLGLPLSISDECERGLALGWELTDWILSSTTPRFAVSSPSNNQCCSSLVAIVSSSFLLLRVCCIVAKSEKNSTTLDQVLLGIWLVEMICTIITLLSPSPVSCASLLISQVNDESMETGKSNLEMDVLLYVLTHMHHLSNGTPKLRLISICGYSNLDLYQIYVEIIESGTWSIGLAARSLKIFNRNHLSDVNQRRKVSMSATFQQNYYVHTQQSLISGSPIGRIEQAYLASYCCTRSSLIDGIHVEDTVPCIGGRRGRAGWAVAHPEFWDFFDIPLIFQASLVFSFLSTIHGLSQEQSERALRSFVLDSRQLDSMP